MNGCSCWEKCQDSGCSRVVVGEKMWRRIMLFVRFHEAPPRVHQSVPHNVSLSLLVASRVHDQSADVVLLWCDDRTTVLGITLVGSGCNLVLGNTHSPCQWLRQEGQCIILLDKVRMKQSWTWLLLYDVGFQKCMLCFGSGNCVPARYWLLKQKVCDAWRRNLTILLHARLGSLVTTVTRTFTLRSSATIETGAGRGHGPANLNEERV